MQKTQNFSLNKPEGTDPMRVTDFNQNSDIIDAALGALAGSRIVTGSYEGTGLSGRTVELGFTPKVIVLMTQWDSYGAVCIATADFAYYAYESDRKTSSVRIVENGVYISGNLFNNNNNPNHYIAFL